MLCAILWGFQAELVHLVQTHHMGSCSRLNVWSKILHQHGSHPCTAVTKPMICRGSRFLHQIIYPNSTEGTGDRLFFTVYVILVWHFGPPSQIKPDNPPPHTVLLDTSCESTNHNSTLGAPMAVKPGGACVPIFSSWLQEVWWQWLWAVAIFWRRFVLSSKNG